jgi:hypothetical protein
MAYAKALKEALPEAPFGDALKISQSAMTLA